MSKSLILVVDDEAGIRFALRGFLEARGYEVLEAGTAAEARASLKRQTPDVVLVDQQLPDSSGVDLLPSIKDLAPLSSVVMLTGHATIELAVRAIKEGADQFLVKPVDLKVLEAMIEQQLEGRRTRISQIVGRSRKRKEPVDPFAGSSPAIRKLSEEVRRLQFSDSPVLIEGATGTGKGVLARWLHQNGPRAKEPFVDLNCAGLARELLETELFGHEKGAFTGAVGPKLGLMEVAHRGSLFLDEIGDLEINVQPKLLTALEEKRFRRLGDVRDRHSDFRLIAASHQDLHRLCHQGYFRLDLYFRLSTIPFRMPSLRERVEDIPLLASGFLARFAEEMGRRPLRLTPSALQILHAYSWPGNIRELRNVLERAALLAEQSDILPEHLRFAALMPEPESAQATETARTPEPEPALAPPVVEDAGIETLDVVERRAIEKALVAEGGHVGRAAQRLGIPRSTLYKRIRHFEIPDKSISSL